jgi:hypothetical protein
MNHAARSIVFALPVALCCLGFVVSMGSYFTTSWIQELAKSGYSILETLEQPDKVLADRSQRPFEQSQQTTVRQMRDIQVTLQREVSTLRLLQVLELIAWLASFLVSLFLMFRTRRA